MDGVGDYTGFLNYGFVPIGRDELGMLILQERVGRQHCIGIAAFEQLQRLAHVFAIDNFRLDGLPDSGVLKGLAPGHAVRRKLRIRQSDETNPICS